MPWPDAVDDILGGDQVVALARRTPASGVVLTPLTNFAVRDREAGTVESLNSSVGLWEKLAAIRSEPRIAVAFHTREHGFSTRTEYVLVQGTATLTPLDDAGYLDRIRPNWERFAGPKATGLWGRWLRIYHWRVAITIAVERIVVWPDLACSGEPEVHGAPLPGEPPAQKAPGKGVGPRVDHARVAERAERLPYVLLGWVGADGFPMAVPVSTGTVSDAGIAVASPWLPPGGRRAGLTAHRFERYAVGQEQRIHTGWLADGVYAPHTEAGYALPASKLLFNLGSGFVTRRGYRAARKAGFLSET